MNKNKWYTEETMILPCEFHWIPRRKVMYNFTEWDEGIRYTAISWLGVLVFRTAYQDNSANF